MKTTEFIRENLERDPMSIYRRNEEKNDHSANAVLMAKLVGDEIDLDRAKTIQAAHQRRGELTPALYQQRREIETRLWPIFRKRYGAKANEADPEVAQPTQEQSMPEFTAESAERAFDKLVEGVPDTIPLNDAVKTLKQYGARNFKTRSNALDFYDNKGRPMSLNLTWLDNADRVVKLSDLNSASRKLKGVEVPLKEDQVDNILEYVTAAYQTLTKNKSAYGEDAMETFNSIYSSLRRALMSGNMDEFHNEWEYYSGRYPDAFDIFAEQMFEEAEIGQDGTIEDFLALTSEDNEAQQNLRENATGGATGAGSVAVVSGTLGEKGDFSKKDVTKKLGGYSNMLTRGGPVKVKKNG